MYLFMSDYQSKWLAAMRSLLHHNVPRFIKHIASRGGVQDEEWKWLQCEDDNPDYPEGLLARADEYLLYPKDEKTFNKALFVLTKAIAIMSFIPGGIHIFGLHFAKELKDFAVVEFEYDSKKLVKNYFHVGRVIAIEFEDGCSET